MDLNLTPAEQAFRDELRAWLSAHVPADWQRQYQRLASFEQKFEFQRRWQRQVYDAGWAGVQWPKEYGGRGATLIEYAIFLEEMARARAPQFAGVLGIGIIGPTIIHFGTDAQKSRYLGKILSGEEIWCQGFSEPGAGSDLASVQSAARLEDGEFVVNGHKIWTSWASAADWCALLVRTSSPPEKHKGLTYLLVDMHGPGVTVRPLRQMTGESEFAEIHFENVRVPAANLLGKLGEGWNVAIGTLMHERSTYGARLHITFSQQLDRMMEIARERRLDADPRIRQKLAALYTDIEIFRLTQMRVLSRVSAGGVPGPEGSVLKLFWSELSQRLQQTAAEILGPYTQLSADCEDTYDGGEFLYGYLRSRGNTIAAGTSEIQRNIIGHNVLGLPKSY